MDMEMLEAISQMMDAKLAQQKQEIATELRAEIKQTIAEAKQHIAKSTVALMDAQFMRQFKALAEGQEDILRRMPNEDDMDIIDGRLADLEADVALLKKAP